MPEIRIGIVGCVGRGRSFFSAFTENPHTTLTALCDIQEDALRKQAEDLGIKHAFTDYADMVDSGEVDAVVIGTPMPLHAPMATAALERNIHVMSEVPASVNLEESRELVLAAKVSEATYMMAENYCYIRTNVAVREMARRGLFGDVYFAEGAYIHELKGLNEITKWRRKWQTGINGVTYPTHSLGPPLQWFGQRAVQACGFGTGHHYTDPRGDQYEGEDSCFMPCRLEGGGLVNIRVDMLSDRPHNLTYYSLQGTDGCYESARGFGDRPKIWLRSLHGDETKWHALEDIMEDYVPDSWKNLSEAARKSGHWGGDYMEVVDFVQAIHEGIDPPIGIHEAMDMTLPGLISQLSIQAGSIWMGVPDSRLWEAEA